MLATDQDRSFGVLLRYHRVEAGLTQRALADKAELSERSIQNLEGSKGQPYADTTRRLVEVLKLSGEVRSIFEAAASPRPRPHARRRAAVPDLQPGAVFLCHGGRDMALIEALADELRAARLEPWLGSGRQPLSPQGRAEVLAGLHAAGACAVLVGADDLGDWTAEELSLILRHAQKHPSFRLFPVLLPGVPEPFDDTTLPRPLDRRPWVDLRGGADRGRALRLLVGAVQGTSMRSERAASIDVGCPYRGLQPFEEEHAELFFGREADTQRLIEKLKGTRFLAVVAPSGTGKSSLVRAGLLPELRRGALPGSNTWIQRVFTPGAQPLTSLAANLLHVSGSESMQRTLDSLHEAPGTTLHLGVSLALVQHPAAARAVFVVDQFEEIFTQCRDEQERAAFIANLLYAAAVPGGQTVVVLTMRADFYARCAAYPELGARIAAHQHLVSPMDDEGLRQAIDKPARRTGLTFEPGLVSTILRDVAGGPGALPLLELALLELWERRQNHLLMFEGYLSSGGVKGAVAARAEAVYDALGAADQAIARRILLRLTEPNEASEDTRRRVPLEELVTRASERDGTERVVCALQSARLVTTSGDERSGEPCVQIAHEALIRGWPRLGRWLDEDRAWLHALRRLREAAQDWQRAGRNGALLYRGPRLAEATDCSDHNCTSLNDLERDFIAESVRLQDRELHDAHEQRKRERRSATLLRFVAAVLFVGVAALGALAAVTVQERNKADGALAIVELQDRAAPRFTAIMRGHVAPVISAVFSPDGQLVLTASNDSTARLWDAATGTEHFVLRGHAAPVTAARFSPDGQLIVTASDDGTARVWEVATGRQRVVLNGHAGGVTDAEFSPDGRSVVTAGTDRTARIWESTTGAELSRFTHTGPVASAKFGPDGQVVVTASDDKFARVWDVGTGTASLLAGFKGSVWDATVGPNGKLVVGVGADATPRVWDREKGYAQLTLLRGHAGPVGAASFSPDGLLLVTASWDGTARVWQTTTGNPIAELQGHAGRIDSARFSPDGQLVVTASWDGTARLWATSTGTELVVLRGHVGRVENAAFSPDGQFVVTAGTDGTARVWRAQTGAIELRGHAGPVSSAAFSPDGRLVLTAGSDGTARIWEATTGTQRIVLGGHSLPVTSASFNADGRLVLTGWDGAVRVWEAATGTEVGRLGDGSQGSSGSLYNPRFSPDGRRVVTSGADGAVRLWEATTGTPASVLLPGYIKAITSVAFSRDGRLLVASGWDWDGTTLARVWDANTGAPVSVLRASGVPHGVILSAPAFDVGGRLIAAMSTDGTARVWDAMLGAELMVLRGHAGLVTATLFSPDGQRLLTASDDGIGRLWDLRSGAVLAELRGHEGPILAASGQGRFILTAGADGTARVWAADTGTELAVLRGHTGPVNAARFSPDGHLLITAGADGTARVWQAPTSTVSTGSSLH